MKRFVFRSLLLGMTVLAITFAADNLQAQKGGGKGGGTPPPPPTNVRYRIHWVTGPAQATQISVRNLAVTMDQNGVPTSALIVGNYNRSDRTSPSAFVYDMQNPSDPTDTVLNRFWDIEELVGSTPASIPWTSPSTPLSSFITVFRGVNSAGLALQMKSGG